MIPAEYSETLFKKAFRCSLVYDQLVFHKNILGKYPQIDLTQHSHTLELKEKCYAPQTCTSQIVFDKPVILVGIVAHFAQTFRADEGL